MVETEKPRRKPSPPPRRAPFIFSAKPGGGPEVRRVCKSRLRKGQNRLAEARCAPVGVTHGLCKQKLTRGAPRHSSRRRQHVLRSRPGPRAAETMGPGTGKGSLTPFLTCPHRTRAPDRTIRPSRNTPASAPLPGRLAPLGVPSLFPVRGAPQGTPRRRPSPRRRRPARDPGHRASRSPPRLRGSERRQRPPPPTPKRGAAAHVPPPAQSGPSLGFGARGSGTSWSKARKGTRAGPLPSQGAGGGRGAGRPLPSSELPPLLPRRRAEITPSPRGSDLGTGAGLRARPLSRLPARIPAPRPKQSSATPTPSGESGCRCPGWSRRRGLHLSVPASGREEGAPRSLPPRDPPLRCARVGSGSRSRSPSSSPSLFRGVILGRSRAFSQDPKTSSFHSRTPGVSHPFSRGNPET